MGHLTARCGNSCGQRMCGSSGGVSGMIIDHGRIIVNHYYLKWFTIGPAGTYHIFLQERDADSRKPESAGLRDVMPAGLLRVRHTDLAGRISRIRRMSRMRQLSCRSGQTHGARFILRHPGCRGLRHFCNKKLRNPAVYRIPKFLLAGDEGFEPPNAESESGVLPLH